MICLVLVVPVWRSEPFPSVCWILLTDTCSITCLTITITCLTSSPSPASPLHLLLVFMFVCILCNVPEAFPLCKVCSMRLRASVYMGVCVHGRLCTWASVYMDVFLSAAASPPLCLGCVLDNPGLGVTHASFTFTWSRPTTTITVWLITLCYSCPWPWTRWRTSGLTSGAGVVPKWRPCVYTLKK